MKEVYGVCIVLLVSALISGGIVLLAFNLAERQNKPDVIKIDIYLPKTTEK